MILYSLIIAIHVIASLVLIAVILLQAGRGGGLSESFGTSSTQTILGTKASTFLKRATEVSAAVFLITCLTLAVLTSHMGRSLVVNKGMGLNLPSAVSLPKAADLPKTSPLDMKDVDSNAAQTGMPVVPQPADNKSAVDTQALTVTDENASVAAGEASSAT